jgi:hypothetical protein
LSVLEGISWVQAAKAKAKGFFIIGGEPGSPYLGKYSSWEDLTDAFEADPALVIGDVGARWSNYSKYGLIFEGPYCKKYDGTSFTDLTSILGFSSELITYIIRDADDSPDYWLVGGGGPPYSYPPRLVKLNHDMTAEDLTSASGLNEPVTSIRYSPTLGVWLIASWNKLLKYDGTSFTDVGSGAGMTFPAYVEWCGSYFLVSDWDLGKIFKSTDGVNFTPLSGTFSDAKAFRWSPGADCCLFGDYDDVSPRLMKYDGSSTTLLKRYDYDIWSIGWNGKYWIIAWGRRCAWSPTEHYLDKYDGTTFTDITSEAPMECMYTCVEWFGELL